MTLTLVWLACTAKPGAPETPEAPPAPPPIQVAPRPAPTPAAGDPATLYAACQDRVEQPQSPGECTSDDDCARSGCSSELCVPRSAGQMMTTCEVQPCFEVLETCGCHDGQCTWTVAAPKPSSP